jgi:hypothetical protein
MTPLGAYILAFMVDKVPLEQHSYYEKLEVTQARYESIAEDTATVSLEYPLFEDDEDGERTGTFIASVAGLESFFRADVDSCKIGGDKDKDGNYRAWTLWQLHANKKKVCESRLAGARVAREMMRASLKQCYRLPFLDRLGVYTDGFCKKNWDRSRNRIKRAVDWVSNHPFSL